jgi:hypothetical protein
MGAFLDLFARLDSEIVKARDSVELTLAILRTFCANSRAVPGRSRSSQAHRLTNPNSPMLELG